MNKLITIKGRIVSLLRIFKLKDIIGTLFIGLIFCLIFFQQFQIFGGFITLLFIHYNRKDVTFCKIVYANNYNTILFFEYGLIYFAFIIMALILKDPFFFFFPIPFILFLFVISIRETKGLFSRDYLNFNFIISYKNYEWRSGIRKNGAKIAVLFSLMLVLIIGTKNIYLFNILLFAFFFLISSFYVYLEPSILLEYRGNSLKEIIWDTFRIHIKSYLFVILVPTIVQSICFYENELLWYSVCGILNGIILILFFILHKYYWHLYNKSKELHTLLNSLATIVILFPPLIVIIIISDIYLYNNLKSVDDDYYKKFYTRDIE